MTSPLCIAGFIAEAHLRIWPWLLSISRSSRSFSHSMDDSPPSSLAYESNSDFSSDDDELASLSTQPASPSSIFKEIEQNLHCSDIASVKFTKLVGASGRQTWHIDKVGPKHYKSCIVHH